MWQCPQSSSLHLRPGWGGFSSDGLLSPSHESPYLHDLAVLWCRILAMGTIMSRFLRCSQRDDETITIGLKTTSWTLKLDHYLGVLKKMHQVGSIWTTTWTSLLRIPSCSQCSFKVENHWRKLDKGMRTIRTTITGEPCQKLHTWHAVSIHGRVPWLLPRVT